MMAPDKQGLADYQNIAMREGSGKRKAKVINRSALSLKKTRSPERSVKETRRVAWADVA